MPTSFKDSRGTHRHDSVPSAIGNEAYSKMINGNNNMPGMMSITFSPRKINNRIGTVGTSLEKNLDHANREIVDFLVPRIDMQRLSPQKPDESPINKKERSRLRKNKKGKIMSRSIIGDEMLLDEAQNLKQLRKEREEAKKIKPV